MKNIKKLQTLKNKNIYHKSLEYDLNLLNIIN